MNIQSLSICVPAKRCINDCKFCCSKMHGADYDDCFTSMKSYSAYAANMRKRMQYARDNGCNTLMLTGNNEPQQNKEFLRLFSEVNNSLNNPFLNIEMQTSGAFIDDDMLAFLNDSIGITTIAISVACLDRPEINRDFIQTKDNNLNIDELCKKIKALNINLRICLNMNDHIVDCMDDSEAAAKKIIDRCTELKADQITFRALWSVDDGTSQSIWIKENVTKKTYDCIDLMKKNIKADGKYLDTLEYGADRYDYKDFSVVVDEDSMSQGENRNAVKYLILRPNGHLYSKWDSKASLIF